MEAQLTYLDSTELERGLEEIRLAPKSQGILRMIVRRPQVEAREVIEEGQLDLSDGLTGDNWAVRGSRSTPDGSANPEMQLNVINARVIDLLTREEQTRWSQAGDQLILDLDLSVENLPTGTRLLLGDEAVIEITAAPHTGCSKFSARFGPEAMRWVNSPVGRQLRLRGLCAKVVQPGKIRAGDTVRKMA
jgi:hypothetical protein